MLNPTRNIITSLSLLFFLFAVAGCDDGDKEFKAEFHKYRYDQQVIDKLPLYDSLVVSIIQNFPAFEKFITGENADPSFLYIPSTDEPDVFIKLPQAAAPHVGPYFNRPGKDFIYGFEIFRDSSIKILVRTRFVDSSKVDITEFMSYYPAGNIRRRQYPDKDTLLNAKWQYWARFSERDVF
jgi:hypothetical protein